MVFEPMAPVWLNFHLRRQDRSIESSKPRWKERLVDDSSPSLVAISKEFLEFLEPDKTGALSRASEGEKSGFWTTLLLLISKSHLTWTLILFLLKRPIFVIFADVEITENKLFISFYPNWYWSTANDGDVTSICTWYCSILSAGQYWKGADMCQN